MLKFIVETKPEMINDKNHEEQTPLHLVVTANGKFFFILKTRLKCENKVPRKCLSTILFIYLFF